MPQSTISPKSIDFYFDFSSPYAYFGALFVNELGLKTTWRPYLMGAALKLTGQQIMAQVPIKRDYAALDIQRTARLYDAAFSMPSYFPFMSVAVCRAFYAIEAEEGQGAAQAFAAQAIRAVWTGGPQMSDKAAILELADRPYLPEAIESQAIKDTLRAQTDAAIARGCWGSPHFFINDGDTSEHFWGADKRDQIQKWIKNPW